MTAGSMAMGDALAWLRRSRAPLTARMTDLDNL
jgi:hypothetical protein